MSGDAEILVIYYSRHGATAELARQIREYLKLKRLRAAFVPPPSSDSAIAECYPVLASLPDDMRRRACLRLCCG
ncbi:MAG: NAD(P)H-quinone oxidoreductase, partial [Proteobacteria bacterium]|nr:NAD(P)H-quinone oxidoreductase [Pseudomonadota bacterium]